MTALERQLLLEPDDHPRTRRPSPEPDDRYQNQMTATRTGDNRSNNQPANTINDSISRSIELNQSFDIDPSPNQIKAS